VQGENWPKAVEYLLNASAKTRARFAYVQAAQFCSEAIGILDRYGGTAGDTCRAFDALGDLESLQGNVNAANGVYERALEVAENPVAKRIRSKQHHLGTVVREGATIAYYDHGIGEPTLFFMHPSAYGIATYQPLIELLCEEFRIVTVDPRGTGGSDPVTGRHYFREHVEDARAVIEAIGNRPVVYVGYSQAGNIAVNLTAKYPQLVERLVLIATRFAPPTAPDRPVPYDRDWWEWRTELVQCLELGEYDRAIKVYLSRVYTEPGTRTLLDLRRKDWSALPRQALQNFFMVALTGSPDPDFDIRPLLPMLRVPTLVLHGTEDRVVPIEDGRYIAGQIPGAHFFALEGHGHPAHYMAPATFAQVLRSFVRTGRPT
jgi:pimeloyl-ACP methyl ester carboxylesterase